MNTKTLTRWQMILFILLATISSKAQQAPSNTNAIATEFDYVLDKSQNYRDLKIVKSAWLQNLKQHVTASYVTLEQQLSHSKRNIYNQKAEIQKLRQELQQSSRLLSKYRNTGATVIFLGIEFNQIVFGTLFSILFFGSLILACILAIKFNKANELTQNAKMVLLELQDEYQEHKQKAIEREQKISRQLQDELNKQKQFEPRKAS